MVGERWIACHSPECIQEAVLEHQTELKIVEKYISAHNAYDYNKK
jgi:hypothetical protein